MNTRVRIPVTRATLVRGAVVALAIAAGSAAYALAPLVLDDDGYFLVSRYASAEGAVPRYYHAAYLVFGWLLEHLVPPVDPTRLLLGVSALCGAASVLLVAASVRRTHALAAAVALAACPGWWFDSMRVEVHSTQLLGAAILAAVGVWCGRRATANGGSLVRFGALAFAAALAMTCHRANMFALVGFVFIAAHGAPRIRALLDALAATVGWAIGTVANDPSGGAAEATSQQISFDLVTQFARGFDFAVVRDDLLFAWFPIAGFALVVGARHWRPAFTCLVAALPSLIFFCIFGLASFGGYFSTFAVFAIVAASRAASRDVIVGPWRTLALAGLLVLGAVVGIAKIRAPDRLVIEANAERRLAAVTLMLPRGGLLIDIDATKQLLDGRAPGLRELELSDALVTAIGQGRRPTELSDGLLAMLNAEHARSRDVAFGLGWHALVGLEPRLVDHLGPFEEVLAALPGVERHTTEFGEYLVARAPASRQAAPATEESHADETR